MNRWLWALGTACVVIVLFLITHWLATRDTRDPALSSFERVVSIVTTELADKIQMEEWCLREGSIEKEELSKPLAYNVMKTDSLVSPYTATISFAKITYWLPEKRSNDFRTIYIVKTMTTDVETHYSYQEKKWVFKTMTLVVRDMDNWGKEGEGLFLNRPRTYTSDDLTNPKFTNIISENPFAIILRQAPDKVK